MEVFGVRSFPSPVTGTLPQKRRHALGIIAAAALAVLALVAALGCSELAEQAVEPTGTPEFIGVVPYEELFRNVEKYVGKEVAYRGRIAQVIDKGRDRYQLRVYVTQKDYGLWDDDVFLEYQGPPRVLENDIIEFKAVVKGLISYRTVLGDQRTIPHLKATSLAVKSSQNP